MLGETWGEALCAASGDGGSLAGTWDLGIRGVRARGAAWESQQSAAQWREPQPGGPGSSQVRGAAWKQVRTGPGAAIGFPAAPNGTARTIL
ncbi:hypothetical protein NN561_020271 [Cricetulus griseus]